MTTHTSIFGRLGAFAVRRRWWVIGLSVVMLAVMGAFAPGLQKRLSPGGFEVPGTEGLSVQQKLDERFTQQFASTALVVVHSAASTVDMPEFAGFVQQLAADLAATDGVEGVVSFYSTGAPSFVSESRTTTYVVVASRGARTTGSRPRRT
ncbi:MAG: hypothetical protein ACRDKW_05425 [Actinomycetota bacterium]